MRQEKKKTIEQSNPSRRWVIKTLAASAGTVVWHSSLPKRWIKPIIESIVLPAHARSSTPITSTKNIKVIDFHLHLESGDSSTETIKVSGNGVLQGAVIETRLNVVFNAYHVPSITKVEMLNGSSVKQRLLVAVPNAFVSSAFAQEIACSKATTVTVHTDGTFSTEEAILSCGPGIVQVLGTVSQEGGEEGSPAATSVLSIPGCKEEQKEEENDDKDNEVEAEKENNASDDELEEDEKTNCSPEKYVVTLGGKDRYDVQLRETGGTWASPGQSITVPSGMSFQLQNLNLIMVRYTGVATMCEGGEQVVLAEKIELLSLEIQEITSESIDIAAVELVVTAPPGQDPYPADTV
ncbi:MAG: hypothetical protein D3924_02395 [Candidatus Electrothrix sp. AR4]|nr:hypothetical protein [Candidatus Electrothrix sp. AR4]